VKLPVDGSISGQDQLRIRSALTALTGNLACSVGLLYDRAAITTDPRDIRQVFMLGYRIVKRPVILAVAILLILHIAFRICRADPPSHSPWELTFNDEFNGQTLDKDKWIAADLWIPAGSTARYYSKPHGKNFEVKDGCCRLMFGNRKVYHRKTTTAHLLTKDFKQKFGYFEVRMKVAASAGHSHAFWLSTGLGSPEAIKKYCAIDIMWIDGSDKAFTEVTVVSSPDGQRRTDSHQWRPPEDLSENYHLYAFEWNDRELIWYFDGRPIRRLPNGGCRYEARVHLRTLITGPAADVLNGAGMEVDYVRVFRRLQEIPTDPTLLDGVQ